MSENHIKFLKHLDDSAPAVWMAAQKLSSWGFSVSIPPTSVASTADQWHKHADSGDLFINHRVEVKSLSAEFSCKEDWPFGKNFIVCAKHSFDNAIIKPYLYIYISRSKTHAAYVPGDTSSQWTVGTRTDSRYNGVSQEFYFCPIDLVSFSDWKAT